MVCLLTKLVDLVKDVFLMIGNYVYPSKSSSFLEQLLLLYPDRMFSKSKNPKCGWRRESVSFSRAYIQQPENRQTPTNPKCNNEYNSNKVE